ncbi:MAG: chemotaxis protein CheW [Fibrobacterota bacterium]
MAEKQYSTFLLGTDLFGIDILLVREINRNLTITPVEQAPKFVSGLLNLRGQIVTVVDMGVRLGLARRVMTPQSRVIVLKTAQELFAKHADERLTAAAPSDLLGLLVDAVGDMVTADDKAVEPPPANTGHVADMFLTGVIKLERGLVGVLDIGKILRS